MCALNYAAFTPLVFGFGGEHFALSLSLSLRYQIQECLLDYDIFPDEGEGERKKEKILTHPFIHPHLECVLGLNWARFIATFHTNQIRLLMERASE